MVVGQKDLQSISFIMSGFQPKNSSISTILAMFNNMLGPAILSLPLIFRDSGVASGTIVLLISAIISFITCRIYVLHSSDEENDIEWTIRRILGKKWEDIFRFITGLYLVLLSIITVDLIVDQFYSIIYLIVDIAGSPSSIAIKDSFVFSKFSAQWLSLLLFVPLLAVAFLKNMTLLVKLNQYGSASIFIYAIFVIIQFIVSAAEGSISMDEIQWFSSGSAAQAGTCILAFSLHTIVITFMKQNKEQGNNMRDLGITYLLAFILYEMSSVLGTFAISSKDCENTFIDCYLADWTVLFVTVSYLISRVFFLPCVLEVGRTRLLQLFLGKVTQQNFRYFNIGFMIIATIFSVLSPYLPISLLMNIVGAVVCYFFIFLIPTKIHYGCLYPKRKANEESLIDGEEDGESTMTMSRVSSCSHEEEYVDKKSVLQRRLIYGAINLFGIVTGIFGLYESIKQLTGQ